MIVHTPTLRLWLATLGIVFITACTGKTIVEAPKPMLDPLPTTATNAGNKGPDPLFQKQWNLNAINVKSAWNNAASSKAVKIMLIGSGIDYNHEDLRSNVFVNQQELAGIDPSSGKPLDKKDNDGDGLVDNLVGWDFIDDDGLAYDRFGIDTWFAGVIAAQHDNAKGIKGVLKRASLYPVRYINENGQSNVPTLIQAIGHIAQAKPHVVLLNLINLKFSKKEEVASVERKALTEALNRAKNTPIIVGAGNNGAMIESSNNVRQLFLQFDNVFMVTSINEKGIKPALANYSSQYVHTSAPGENILTTAPGNTYITVDSTTLAAAHITAAIALAISLHHGQTAYKRYFNALLSTSGSVDKQEMAPYTVGRNTLNIERFLAALER